MKSYLNIIQLLIFDKIFKIPKSLTVKNLPNFAFKIIFFFAFTISFSAISQTKEDVSQITKEYDFNKLKELENKYFKKFQANKKKALQVAKAFNWPEFIKNQDGSVDELVKLAADGSPLYYSTNNVNAAKSTRTNFLNSGGSLGLNLNGQNMTGRVWDGGKVRASHQEFGGRVSVIDDVAGPSGNNFHATHVTGTMVAAGVDTAAKGMAPSAQARTFNWTNDSSEALSEVTLGMLISNHSYGVPLVSNGQALPAWYIGAYTDESYEWDEVAYNSPYYLMVVSAGNDGNVANPSPSTNGYDKLTGNKVSKNNLVVANAEDAVIGANGVLTSVAINSSSSQGPADDLRVKPDITGNGTGVYSTYETSNTAYGTISGTSMASPNVAGTLLLLQQHYKNINNRFMKAATLKALACHTADDAGRPGPDAVFGWGLLNAKKAAETITTNGLSSIISEEKLAQGQTFTMTVNASGSVPLQASIAWTDLPGTINEGELNSASPALVNDLDIKITKNNTTFFPYSLTANANSNAIATGQNNVDNIEKVNVASPSGSYTITVTHKGTLQNGPHNFALVVTGVSSSFALTNVSEDQVICNTGNVVFNFNHTNVGLGSTALSLVDLPAGVTGTLSTPNLISGGSLTVTLSNLTGLTAGDYTIGVKGIRGSETKIKYVTFKVYAPTFTNLTLSNPANSQNGLATSVNLAWQSDLNAESYRVQVATDNAFANIIQNEVVTSTNYLAANLSQETTYYWRVLPQNRCSTATSGSSFSFTTGVLSCNLNFTATDFSDAVIENTEDSEANIPVTVSGGITIGTITATVNISHTYTEDIVVTLVGPASIGSPEIRLFNHACTEYDNIVATLSDAGTTLTCSTTAPAISGTIKPYDPFYTLNNLPADGVWTLNVFDPYNGDGGVVNAFSLNFCNVAPSALGVSKNIFSTVKVYPNPTKGIVTVSLPQNSELTTLTLVDIQGRQILKEDTSNTSETLNIENFSDGVYILNIQSGSSKISKKLVLNR